MDISRIKQLVVSTLAAGALFVGSSAIAPTAAHADERGWHGDHDGWRGGGHDGWRGGDHDGWRGREGYGYRHDNDWRFRRGGGPGYGGPEYYGRGRVVEPGYYGGGYHRGPSVIIAP